MDTIKAAVHKFFGVGPAPVYHADRDPAVRRLRLQQRQSERAVKRLERRYNPPFEDDVFPRAPKRKGEKPR